MCPPTHPLRRSARAWRRVLLPMLAREDCFCNGRDGYGDAYMGHLYITSSTVMEHCGRRGRKNVRGRGRGLVLITTQILSTEWELSYQHLILSSKASCDLYSYSEGKTLQWVERGEPCTVAVNPTQIKKEIRERWRCHLPVHTSRSPPHLTSQNPLLSPG